MKSAFVQNIDKSRRRLFCVAIGVAALALSAGTQPVLAQTAEQRLSSGKLTIGIHNRAPWGYRAASGAVEGYHPDLVRAAFEPLGVKEIDFVVSEFGALIPGLNANRFDLIASGIAITPARCEQVIFSEPDLSVGDGLLVKAGNPHKIHSYQDIIDNPEVRLAGGRGTLNTRNAINAGVPEDRILQLQDVESQVSALLAGRADAATISAPSVVSVLQDSNIKGLERAQPFTGLVLPNGQQSAMYTAIAFRRSDTELRDAFNKQLAILKENGTLKSIMDKYGFTEAENPPKLTTAEICAAK